MHVHDFFAMGCDKGTTDIDEFPWLLAVIHVFCNNFFVCHEYR